MRDLIIDELDQVYGAGGRGCCWCPPSCGGGSKSKKSKSKKSKSKKSKCKSSKSKKHSRQYC